MEVAAFIGIIIGVFIAYQVGRVIERKEVVKEAEAEAAKRLGGGGTKVHNK